MIAYFTADIICLSPIKIGSGKNENTDMDVLVDSDNKPFIPGTTLAGICRHFLASEAYTDVIFGGIKDNGHFDKSLINFYDAEMIGASLITLRDGVHLADDRTVFAGGKWDYEIVEAGCSFRFRISFTVPVGVDYNDILSRIILGFKKGDIRIGGKTTRGFGRVAMENPKYKLYMLPEDLEQYIDFKWSDITEEYIPREIDTTQYIRLRVQFELVSFLFIRNQLTLAVDPYNDNKAIDAEQLKDNFNRPVIPGTAWAGVFRHHFRKVLNKVNNEHADQLINEVFGYVDEGAKGKSISKIIFAESRIEKSHFLNRTRNAIDRFTGGAGDKKLFTTRPAYQGQGKLEILLHKNTPNIELVKSLIAVCIDDFNDGLLTVGGEASTGGGLIKINREGALTWT